MDVRDSVLASIREYDMLSGADRIICAFSGGADSVCLADALLALSPELGFRMECAHFDHLLRGEESRRDAAFAAAWCAERKLKLHTGSGDAAAYALQQRMGIEEAARELRYAFLESLGDERTRIATAHQADDQAETILMDLIRGSGLHGLCGIPPVRGRFIRPLLGVGREEILAYLELRGLEHVEDSSNRDTAYRRNQLRHEIMPMLRQLNPAVTAALGRTSRLLREDEKTLSEMAEAHVAVVGGQAELSVKELLALPQSLSSRALRSAAGHFGVKTEEKHISAMLALAASSAPSGQIALPGGLTARRQYEKLLIGRLRESPPMPERKLSYGEWTEIPERKMLVFWGEKSETAKIHGKFTTFFFKKERICGTITVRLRREGDRLALPGRTGKSLKKWMIQEKITSAARRELPVFADEEGVVAVLGLGADERVSASPEAADSVLVILERT